MKYYSDNYATIEWDAASHCVKTTFTGIPKHSLHFRLIQRKRLEFIAMLKERYTDFSIFTDSRKAGPLIPDDIAFFQSKVVPRLATMGIKKIALLEPESIFTKMVIGDLMNEASEVQLAMFGTEEAARMWLQPKPALVA